MPPTIALAILLAALCSPVFSASAQSDPATQPVITASPVFSQSPVQSFPRVSGLANKAIQAQVNKLLDARERNDRNVRTDCLRAYVSHGKPSYSELIRLTYLSPRLLSIDVRTSSLCDDSYPNFNMTYPLTLDLTTGRELDWHRFFVNEFLNPPADKPSLLLPLYLRYAPPSEDCNEDVNDPGTTFSFWLDSTRKSLMARPSLPHVAQACAVLAAIPFAEILSQIHNPLDRQDLLTQPTP
jgi:hypothetical protein